MVEYWIVLLTKCSVVIVDSSQRGCQSCYPDRKVFYSICNHSNYHLDNRWSRFSMLVHQFSWSSIFHSSLFIFVLYSVDYYLRLTRVKRVVNTVFSCFSPLRETLLVACTFVNYPKYTSCSFWNHAVVKLNVDVLTRHGTCLWYNSSKIKMYCIILIYLKLSIELIVKLFWFTRLKNMWLSL